MFTNDIICVGDGYAYGHIWPEWPQILQALLIDKNIKVISGVGAGEEFLVTGVIDLDPWDSDVIFQWPCSPRFDKLIEDDSWLEKAKSDPIYFFNIYDSPHGQWWLSSASQNHDIKTYHNIVQPLQYQLRSRNYKKLLEAYLELRRCRYLGTTNREQDVLAEKYRTLRGTQIQPSPIIHYYFVIEYIIPKMQYTIDSQRSQSLEKLILRQQWHPYHPDRQQIWEELVQSLD